MKTSKLVLDIDGVLCDFVGGMYAFAQTHGTHHLDFNKPEEINTWNFFSDEIWQKVLADHSFWAGLKPLNDANKKLEIIPAFYLTARPCPSIITLKWLEYWGFPMAEVVTVKSPLEKVIILPQHPEHILVDDHIDTIQTLLNAGGTGVLYKAKYQEGHQTDHLPMIETVEEINLLGGAMNYREYREKLKNVKSQTKKDMSGSEESRLVGLAQHRNRGI